MTDILPGFQEIASRHGVDLAEVEPDSVETRLEKLRVLLDDTNVPFPIEPGHGRKYFEAAKRGEKFGVGTLGDESVDLGEYANTQNYDAYTDAEHLSWACLIAEQKKTKHRYACREYLEGESVFEIGGTVIPDYWLLNARIYQQTNWQLATVNKIIPAELFFTCHSKRFFPVTTFMRPLEQDYLQEPDIGHDVAGHVATFTIPAVANVMRNHGLARDLVYAELDQKLKTASDEQQAKVIRAYADELLLYAGRIYWFTVEFGLVLQDGDVRDFGAGILSSPGETKFSIDSAEPNRVLIDPGNDEDLLRLATTDYLISEFQKTYFVMTSFDRLESLTPDRILAAAKLAAKLPHYTWREIVPGDSVLNVGTVMNSPNEKYFRLIAGQAQDECLTRAAVRNLTLLDHGLATGISLEKVWKAPMPAIPDSAKDWHANAKRSGKLPKIEMPLSD